jgi:hypothetical protein
MRIASKAKEPEQSKANPKNYLTAIIIKLLKGKLRSPCGDE